MVHDVRLAIREYYPTGFVTRAATLSNTVRPYEIEQRTVLEKGRDQFIKEARNLSRFRDRPEVVTVKDFFYQNDTAYVVMTYTEGQTLLQYLETMGGKLPAAQVFEMMHPLINALGDLHKKGFLHRAISPDHMMLMPEGAIKLSSFGVAREFF